ncbi:uncharacterized protein LAJ45_10468 [Morchella importuna]|uniref:uncharacterized protein n=1 Tax=Morchella importuna TaxID=1174673 RepID=UPI001E8D6AE6|nr:uncharacterized protein LAJ45_10468 [Morchella importuna]KAH8145498.1 hypothetical protein LAJ45_10468 [Morchella importuna]
MAEMAELKSLAPPPSCPLRRSSFDPLFPTPRSHCRSPRRKNPLQARFLSAPSFLFYPLIKILLRPPSNIP